MVISVEFFERSETERAPGGGGSASVPLRTESMETRGGGAGRAAGSEGARRGGGLVDVGILVVAGGDGDGGGGGSGARGVEQVPT